MTLVLPFGGDQIANSNLFMRSGSNQNSSMPCVFENDAFEGDFESALMRDWASEINDYDMSSDDSPIKAPSDSNELKRKSPIDSDEVPEALPKKPRLHNSVPHVPSGLVSSSSSDHCTPSSVSSSFLEPSLDTPSASSSSSSSSSSEGDVSAEDDYMPRRRGIQMWNSRQRWKDERKKVMKMSVTKLAEIDDPELCLLRSVLINNTIKKLHSDIKNDRQAKQRHRQQRMDFFAERFPPLASSDEHLDFEDNETKPTASNPPDFYDDNSCDEMFGISEDFLRVTIPDRRVSSPIPTRSDESSGETSMEASSPVTTSSVTCPISCYSNSMLSCDTAVDCSSPFCQRRSTNSSSSQTVVASSPPAFPTSPPLRRPSVVGGGQCATQYRTNGRDLGSGDVSFPPRVPILDSVVYHSLLASLESS